ncbi:hypothetical protein CYY_008539 [Polysphondylium violaceum]|uniref:Transmembrane protein n=1 Tax=Polysphondylium violaceum TaxID=133409 RepID=A0A8J4UWV4_9MYCE|nr:hypothetical protein CYY_008539 [Polysphondylium violaceum]
MVSFIVISTLVLLSVILHIPFSGLFIISFFSTILLLLLLSKYFNINPPPSPSPSRFIAKCTSLPTCNRIINSPILKRSLLAGDSKT